MHYEITVTQINPQLYQASTQAFDNIPNISAPTPEKAIELIKNKILEEGVRRLNTDMNYQIPSGIEINAHDYSTPVNYIIDCPIIEHFKENSNETVRRTISLPKWLDTMIRKSDIDSSALFREAATSKFKATTSQDKETYQKIDALEKSIATIKTMFQQIDSQMNEIKEEIS